MNRNRLYATVGILFMGGFLWLAASEWFPQFSGFGICLFKHITGIPCPSCGVTRSIGLLLHGNVRQSVLMNPLGILMAPALLVIPVWIAFDYFQDKQTFFLIYKKSEKVIRKPQVAVILVVLLLLNWAWGISKGL